MAIQPPQGILNIPNATLRVGKLAVDSTAGFDTVFNNVERNTILLEDSTEYTDTKQWDLKMPNIFVATFEINGVGSSFNFRNTSNGVATTGYTLTFSGTTLTLKYNNASLTTATIPDLDSIYGKVYLTYEKQHFTVTVDGTLVLTYKDTGTRTFPDGEYANFFKGTGSSGFKNLKVVAGHFISDGTSNIAYVGGGEVAVGKALAFNRVSNVSQIKVDSNVVAEYTGPHDRPLRKYPEVAMTSASQGGYVVTTSSQNTGASRQGFNLFDNSITTTWQAGSADNLYSGTTPFAYDVNGPSSITDVDNTIHRGAYVKLQLPKRIRLSHVIQRDDTDPADRVPGVVAILGSNDGTNWTFLKEFTGLSATQTTQQLNVNSTGYYNHYAYLVKNLADGDQALMIGGLEYYGYEEGSGSIDTTLKSVYNVPATTGTQLEVYYDANKTSNYTLSGSDVTNVSDLSPQSRDSTATNVTIDSTWNAFRFSGSGSETKIENFTISGGDYVHSISLWFNSDEDYTDITSPDTRKIFFLGADVTSGSAATDGVSALQFTAHDNSNEGYLRWYHWGNDTNYSIKLRKNEWYHVTLVYKGGTSDTQEVYINNKFIEPLDSGSSSNQISLPTTIDLFLGRGRTASRNAFKGMIANFRLYSKALNADQVKELYDYQKDYFFGTHSSVTLHKGRFGVGTKEPMKELDVVGDVGISANLHMTTQSSVLVNSNVVAEYTGPHDRPLREYPEINMTTATTGGYTASASIENNTTTHAAFNAFTSEGFNRWQNGGTRYDTNSPFLHTAGESTTDTDGTSHLGDWIQLQLPNKINLSRIRFSQHSSAPAYQPKSYVVLGSNDDTSWKLIHTQTNLPEASANTNYKAEDNFMTVGYYKYLRLVVKSLQTSANQIIILRLQYYGYEEGSGSLDTTLKSVYNVPATTGTQLEVYYDGQDYTGVTSTVNDKVGTATNATIANTDSAITFDSTYKAWTFGGTDTRTSNIQSSALASTFSGDQVHSVALWFKCDIVSGDTLFSITQPSDPWEDPKKVISVRFSDESGGLRYLFWSNDIQYDGTEAKITKDIWYHLCVTYSGGGGTTKNKKLYLNGNELHHTSTSGDYPGANLELPSGSVIRLGSRVQETTRFFGSIANFRLYSKALNADQVKELYDYQKDYFLGSKSQVTLYKGHLGVGVTEPSGQLELAGDERIQEYPPGPMDDYDTHIPGHGVFKVYASTEGDSSRLAWMAFNDESGETTSGSSGFWRSIWNGNDTDGPYHSGTGAYVSNARLGSDTALGEYVVLQLPYKIQLRSVRMSPWYRTASDDFDIAEFPKNFTIYGSNDGNNWYSVFVSPSQTLTASSGSGATTETTSYSITSNEYYKYFGLVVTETNYGNYSAIGYATTIGNLQYFGTPGPTTLDKGSLTLGRSLDVPRISRYDVDTETPRPEKLVVDFDTTVNSSPTDISGKGNHGAFYNGASYSSADKAFVFDGTDDYIQTAPLGFSGDQVHSVSLWFWSDKPQTDMTTEHGLYGVDGSTSDPTPRHGLSLWSYVTKPNSAMRYWHSGSSGKNFPNTRFAQNTWNHIVVVYPGGGAFNVRVWLNGVEQEGNDGGSTNNNFSWSTSNDILIGDWYSANSPRGESPWDGKMSNFRVYNVALEPSGVKKLYNLGRTGRSMVISDTAVGIGKVPEAQLDVRGVANFGSRVGIGESNPETYLHLSAKNSNPGATEGDFAGTHDLTEYLRFTSLGDSGDINAISVGFKLGGDDNSTQVPDGRLDICANDGASAVNAYGSIPDRTIATFLGSGNVGIGTTDPSYRLEVGVDTSTGSHINVKAIQPHVMWQSATAHWQVWNNGTDEHLRFYCQSDRAYLQCAGTNDLLNFTGQHRTFIKDVPFSQAGDLEGLIVSSDQNKYIKMSGGIECGTNAITVNESLPVVSVSNVFQDKRCFGVISTSEDPDTREDKHGNLVSIFDKEGGDTRVYINSVGEGAIWVTNINGNLESGDYITTSNVAGYGMKQESEFLANYTVAKITMDCDFEPVTQPVQVIRKEMGDVNYWVKTTYENVTEEEYSNLVDENRRIVDDIYQKIITEESKTEQEGYEPEVRRELVNVLDEHGQIQWEDDPSGATEKAYKIRYLDANGVVTDEANHVHKAAFVGCTYHCG